MRGKKWDKNAVAAVDVQIAAGKSKEEIIKNISEAYKDRSEKAINQFVSRRMKQVSNGTTLTDFQNALQKMFDEGNKLVVKCQELQGENKNLKADLEKLQGLRKAVEAYSGAGK